MGTPTNRKWMCLLFLFSTRFNGGNPSKVCIIICTFWLGNGDLEGGGQKELLLAKTLLTISCLTPASVQQYSSNGS